MTPHTPTGKVSTEPGQLQATAGWLAWLDSRGLLDAQIAPEIALLRIGSEPIFDHLEAENASGTVIARIIELKIIAAIMDPGRDWSWIYRFASSMRVRHKPARPKRHRLVHIRKAAGSRSGSDGEGQ